MSAATVAGVPHSTWDPARWLAWCSTCQADTESDDTTDPRWCATCGDKRES